MRPATLLLLSFAACGDGPPPAGADAGVTDARPGEDASVGAGPALLVPAAIIACNVDRNVEGDARAVLAAKARLSLRAGRHALDGPIALVASLELGSPPITATSTGPARVVRSREEGFEPADVFTIRQRFYAAGAPVTLELRARFPDGSGARELTLDLDALSQLRLSPTLEAGGTLISLGACDYARYGCASERFTFEGGGALELEACTLCPSDFICKSDLAGVRSATFSLGGETRSTSDPLRLAASMRHHNWGRDALILIDPPLGGVHGLSLASDPYPDFSRYSEVRYLGGDLLELERHAVLSGP